MKRIVEQDRDEDFEDENLEALQELLRKKEEIEYRIEMLQHSKDDHRLERERLETDLDQIVYVIKNKGNLKVANG